jgi:hypothetical protein
MGGWSGLVGWLVGWLVGGCDVLRLVGWSLVLRDRRSVMKLTSFARKP